MCLCVWLQIYTDWANHYLAKSGHKRLIKDLQTDVTDGVLLAEIIQVVGKQNTRLIPKILQKEAEFDTCDFLKQMLNTWLTFIKHNNLFVPVIFPHKIQITNFPFARVDATE